MTQARWPPQRLARGPGKHAEPVLVALARPHDDLVPVEIDVLDPQTAAFQEPRARSVEAFAERATDYVLKPINLQALVKKVQQHLAGTA